MPKNGFAHCQAHLKDTFERHIKKKTTTPVNECLYPIVIIIELDETVD